MQISSAGNILIMQSGGCTPVINRSLRAAVEEITELNLGNNILGAHFGLEGLLQGQFIDLGRISKSKWDAIAQTPGAALGSTRRKLTEADESILLKILKEKDIRFLFIIGGNDSATTGEKINQLAKSNSHRMTIINIPKTIDNDLVKTDHSPGYGSAARFVALATMGSARDAESMSKSAPITLIEVMGRDSGWLASASALAKREEKDGPHLIYVPEIPVNENHFLSSVKTTYDEYGFAIVVIAENIRSTLGVFGDQKEPMHMDDFGHPYFSSPGLYLSKKITETFGLRARYESPGTIQRSMMSCLSSADAEEADMAGRAAVRYAIEGESSVMVTLERESGREYKCTTGLSQLVDVAGRVKTMPSEFLDAKNAFVTKAFLDYLAPLIGAPLPEFGRLY